MLSITNGKHKMSDHVFQMSSLILCHLVKCTQEKELLTSHGMHVARVCINFLLKSQLYVVLQPRNSCHSVFQTPGVPPAQQQT